MIGSDPTFSDLSEISYPPVITIEPGSHYQANIGQHVLTLRAIPTIPGSWTASVAGLGLVGGNNYDLAGPRFYWSEGWAYAFRSAKEALIATVALVAVIKDAPHDVGDGLPGPDFPVAVLAIDPAQLAAFAGVPYPLPDPNDAPVREARPQLSHLLDRIAAHRPDLIRAIVQASSGLDDLEFFGADGVEEFLGFAVDRDDDPAQRPSRRVHIDQALINSAAAIRARLAAVLPMVSAAPLCVVINTQS